MLINNISNKRLLTFQLICCIASTIIGINLGAYTDLAHSEGRLYKNTFIENIDVGNQSIEEAISLISKDYLEPLLENDLNIYFNDKSFTVPLRDLFESSNLEQVVRDPIDYVDQLNLLEKLEFLLGKPYSGFNIEINFNTASIQAFTQEIIDTLTIPYQDAHITISNSTPEHSAPTINITPHVKGISIREEVLSKEIKLLLNNRKDFFLDLSPLIISKSPNITTDTLKTIDTIVSQNLILIVIVVLILG